MEIWDLYDEDRVKTDRQMVRGERVPEGYFRLVVHVCLFNARGEMLIQQRQPFKSGWPGLWDITAGGSAIAGDDSRSAALRELGEELGIRLAPNEIRPALSVRFSEGFNDVYLGEYDGDLGTLTLQAEEVAAVRYATLEEMLAMIDEGSFIPYHKHFIHMLFYLRQRPELMEAPQEKKA